MMENVRQRCGVLAIVVALAISLNKVPQAVLGDIGVQKMNKPPLEGVLKKWRADQQVVFSRITCPLRFR